MDNEKISDIIVDNYGVKPIKIEKIKNVYKVECKDNFYCLKVINYDFKHFYFILSAIMHLQNKGFQKIPTIIKTKSDEYYIHLCGKNAYLTKWVLGRESNYDNPLELIKVSKKLAELHLASEDFNVNSKMRPRIGWFSWINVFETRKKEIIDFKNRIEQKFYRDEFDQIYLECIPEEINRADKAIQGLKESDYIKFMEREVFRRGFCHHDYANHNILIDNNEVINIIDFDYCILDTCLHDLSSLMIRAMKNGKWDIKKASLIIENYSDIKKINRESFQIIKNFIRFPQDFWQIGLQKYWEQQPWEQELFLNKISKYVKDRNEREEFVDSFFS